MDMDMGAALTVAISALGIIGTIFHHAVIRPLTKAIADLRELIDEMRRDLRVNEEKRQGMDVRLAKVESSAASAHHRIDTLEGRLGK